MKNNYIGDDNMMNCKSKEGKEIEQKLMSYITLQLLSNDKFRYKITEEKVTNTFRKIFNIKIDNCRAGKPFYSYDFEIRFGELNDLLYFCNVEIVFSLIRYNNRDYIKKWLLENSIENYKFRQLFSYDIWN